MDKPLWMWVLFLGIVVTLLAFDLGVLHKKDKVIGVKESLILSCFYIIIALLFGCYIAFQMGQTAFAEYMTGYLIEKSLSLDNVFVISLIFGALSIPPRYQHRVLFWGILGVIILRGIMIALGAQLVSNFAWVIDLFAIFLIITGIKMLFVTEKEVKFEENRLLKFLRRKIRITDELVGHHFIVKQLNPKNQKIQYYATPLLIALIMIEAADVIFAVDSIPAIFIITQDPYLVYTANIFACLGLRALYFALAAMIEKFEYLKYALALVLIFIGSKVFIAKFLGLEKFPASVSLGVTFALLTLGCVTSLLKTKNKHPK